MQNGSKAVLEIGAIKVEEWTANYGLRIPILGILLVMVCAVVELLSIGSPVLCRGTHRAMHGVEEGRFSWN